MNEILVIDDERSILDALHMIFEDYGFRVRGAASGREAIALARRHDFALAITDYGLPDTCGTKLLTDIAEISPSAPVILISGRVTPELRAEAEACGAAGVLAKPFAPSAIISLVTKVLDLKP
ncbi:MAG TPA: response regulator [Pyrinomonadaceae bacterium]|nr:response regulator [Pyrinomonadaceae bacterium]